MTNISPSSINFTFAITCEDIHQRFIQYCVETTDENIQQNITFAKSQTLQHLKSIFRSVYGTLVQYDEPTLQQHFIAKNKEWTDWCDDVVVFYAVRLVLFKKVIPIIKMHENQL